MSDEITAAIESSIADIPDAPDTSAAVETPSELPDSQSAAQPQTTAEGAAAPDTQKVQPQPEVEKKVRRGPIPHDRHEAALATLRKESEETLSKQRQEYESRMMALQQRAEILDFADRYPDKFIAALAQADPRMAAAIQAIREQNGNGHQPQQPVEEPMPQPDARFPDGSVGYSPDGLEKYMAWRERQIESRIAAKFKPLQDAHDAQEQVRGAMSRVQVQVQEAMQWEGFQENQAAIGEALKADRRLSLEGAYRKVVLPKLKADRDKMRSELVAELNAKPKHVTQTTPAGGHVPAASSDDLESIIKASIANHPER